MKQPNKVRSHRLIVALGIAAIMMVGCAAEPVTPSATTLTATPPPPEATAKDEPAFVPLPAQDLPQVTLESVTDGDTIKTSEGIVRIIGIDSPERGECGYQEASEGITAVVPLGEPVLLMAVLGQEDVDRYGRMLRYVVTPDRIDVGLAQIEAGHAVARYDSTDGYPPHPSEEIYQAAQTATLEADGTILTLPCKTEREKLAADKKAQEEKKAQADKQKKQQSTKKNDTVPKPTQTPWYQEYPSCAALKRNTVGHPVGPFHLDRDADIYNWFQYGTGHRGDGDGDGYACE